MRGDIRVKNDTAVSAADIANYNLVLFGDPGSNSVMAKVIGQLPIQWTRARSPQVHRSSRPTAMPS